MLSRRELDNFLRRRLGAHLERGGVDAEAVLVDDLTAAILAPCSASEWRRRPSLCHDGTPAQLSQKLAKTDDDTVRLLVEPGRLDMTVAEQIAFSLSTLDEMLGHLSWRSAADDINAITSAILPPDAQATRDWWGGMWLGASLPMSTVQPNSPAELRMYINLRFGDSQARWHRVADLFARFGHSPSDYTEWFGHVAQLGIPVGLGVVVANGHVGALRIYVAAPSEDLCFLRICEPISGEGADALTRSFVSFVDKLGSPPSKTVTVGFDFLRNGHATFDKHIGRVKVELSCQGVTEQQRITSWLNGVIADWLLDIVPLRSFGSDIEQIWTGYNIEHVSLGFAPDPKHVTVYVKPW